MIRQALYNINNKDERLVFEEATTIIKSIIKNKYVIGESLPMSETKSLILNEGEVKDLVNQFHQTIAMSNMSDDAKKRLYELENHMKILISNSMFEADSEKYWKSLSKIVGGGQKIIMIKDALRKSKISEHEFFTEIMEVFIPNIKDDDLTIDNRISGSFLFKSGSGNLNKKLLTSVRKKVNISDNLWENLFYAQGGTAGAGETLLELFIKGAKDGSDVNINDKEVEIKSGVARLGNQISVPFDAKVMLNKYCKSNPSFENKLNELKTYLKVKTIYNVMNLATLVKIIPFYKNKEYDVFIKEISEVYSSVTTIDVDKFIKAFSSKNRYDEIKKIVGKMALKTYKDYANWDSIMILKGGSKKKFNGDYYIFSDDFNIDLKEVDVTCFYFSDKQNTQTVKLSKK